jgi:chromosome segregation ATPase
VVESIDYLLCEIFGVGSCRKNISMDSRKRKAVETVNIDLLDDDDDEEDNYSIGNVVSGGHTRTHGGDDDVDDLHLEIEQLHSKLTSVEDEYKRFQDKHVRQCSFLETEINDLKKALTTSNEKYFEEKKKWQAKVRTLTESTGAGTSKQSTTAADTSSARELVDKVNALESKLTEKNSEVRRLTLANADLETKLQHAVKQAALQQSLSMAASQSSSNIRTDASGLEADATENESKLRAGQSASEQTKKISELEYNLSRRQREISKLESKLQNSVLLEQEIDRLKTKIGLLEGKLAESEVMESQYKTLQLEKQEWASLLASLQTQQQQHHGLLSPQSSSSSMTPVTIIRALSAAQKKCAQLTANESSLQSKLSTYKQTIDTLEAQLESQKQSSSSHEEEMSRATNRQRLLQQQVSTYEREVKNLRKLVQTYDTELQLGHQSKAATGASTSSAEGEESLGALVKRKESMITELRAALDETRQANKQVTDQLKSSEETVAELKKKLQQQQVVGNIGDVTAMAVVEDTEPAEGLDFDPKEVKVWIEL